MSNTKTGFNKFSSPMLAVSLWIFMTALVILFIVLNWTNMQIGLVIIPLLAVTIAVTVTAIKNYGLKKKNNI